MDTLLERKDSSLLSQNGLIQLLSHHKNITIFDASVLGMLRPFWMELPLLKMGEPLAQV